MKAIDVHHHWVNETGYLDRLLGEMDRLEIEKTGLIALGAPFRLLFLTQSAAFGCCDNQDLAELLSLQSDRFFGYGFFRLGEDHIDLVDWFADNGFLGLKFHIPAWDYDDERAFPIYERASQLGLVCLFHTGVFTLPEPLSGARLSSARCRPIMLDPIAQEFPKMKIITAHLGVCWGEEAATLCRIHRNIYADLSGKVDGWISSKSIAWFQEMLYWPEASQKILFGSDVHCSELEETLTQQTTILSQLGWTADQIGNVLNDNAKTLFRL